MLGKHNKRKRLIFVCNLLNIAGWGCLLFWLVGLVALPSLLAQTNKAKGVEARNITGAMNRAQQAFNLEKGGFADSMEQLGVGIKSQTENYDYSIIISRNKKSAFHLAIPRKENLKRYVGVVWTEEDAGTKGSTTRALLCEPILVCNDVDVSQIKEYKAYLSNLDLPPSSQDICFWL